MYGIVNKAIQGLVTSNFGEDKWLEVKAKSEVNVTAFISNEPYEDDITFKLAIAASDVLQMELEDVLHAFGEYWILETGLNHYGHLLKAGGDNLKEFLINLPNFHSRIMLMYPELNPPEFQIEVLENNALIVHYYSSRNGLSAFMQGLLSGTAKMYQVDAQVEQTGFKGAHADHDSFKVTW